jgi:hypothetical protein
VEHRASLALQAAHPDSQPTTALLHRRQQFALPQALLQGPLVDGQRLVDRLAETLADRERRLRLQIEVGAVEPADAAALGLPATGLVVPTPEGAEAPAPGDGGARRVAGRRGHVGVARGEGSFDQVEEHRGRLGRPDVLALRIAELAERPPGPLPEPVPHLGVDRADVLGELEEALDADSQVGDGGRGAAMSDGARRGLSQFLEARLHAARLVAVLWRQPAEVAGHGGREHTSRRQVLERGQPDPVHVCRPDLDDEQAGAERLTAGDVLAGAEQQAARRLGWAQGGVRSHPPGRCPGRGAGGQPRGGGVGRRPRCPWARSRR